MYEKILFSLLLLHKLFHKYSRDKMAKTPHILIIYTGGTIGMIKDYKTNVLHAFDFDHIYKSIPELNHLNCSIESISFEKPIDSSNMNPSHWESIAKIIQDNYKKVDGFVVLHGSDTMAYTASAISFMFENLSKPVIFTGSQLPIGHLRTDAKENMITAIEIAAAQKKSGKPKVAEVCIYFEYKLYRANRTTKTSAEQFEAFSSPNYPELAESGVHLKFNKSALLTVGNDTELIYRKINKHNIVLLKIFPGITKEVVQHIFNTPKLEGIILEAYGSGNAPTDMWFIDLLKDALHRKIPIIDITQCVAGSVMLGKYETSAELLRLGLINGYDITSETAVSKLLYLLSTDETNGNLKELFETPLRGEITVI
jgi:L-asparaginase